MRSFLDTTPVSYHLKFPNHLAHREESQDFGTKNTSTDQILGAQIPDHVENLSWTQYFSSTSRRVGTICDEVL